MSDRPDGTSPRRGATAGDTANEGSPPDGGDSSSRLRALVGSVPRALALALLALVVVVVVAYFLGVVGVPSAGLVDRGDWGNVTEERTEVVTTVWIRNANPFPIQFGDGLSAAYTVAFNDVALARGEIDAIRVPRGNTTMGLHTDIQNDRLPAWWVAFVRANETITVDINGTLSVNAGPTVSHDIHREQTVLENATPIVTALSSAANGTTGTYTRSVGADQVSDGVDLDALVGDEEVTVGYEIREGRARWAGVTEEQTTVAFEFVVHNPGDVPVPAVPDGLGVAVDMNDVRLFEGESGTLSPGSVGPDAVIPPGETRTVVFTVRMDNDRVDEWFTSHVRRGEQTTVRTQFQFVFEVPATGSTFRIPRDSPATYDCQLRTAILVDNQTTGTDCGEPGSTVDGGGGDGADDGPGTATSDGGAGDEGGSDGGDASPTPVSTLATTAVDDVTPTIDDATPTAVATPTATATPGPPTARVSANTTSGSAPLTVAFDGSASTDPDGDIARYTWRFDDLSPPGEGETVTHTFETPGSYDVVLTVVDETGRQDTATVTIEVTLA